MAKPTKWISESDVVSEEKKLQGANLSEVELIERCIEEIKELAGKLESIYNTSGGSITRKELYGVLDDDYFTALNSVKEEINSITVKATKVEHGQKFFTVRLMSQ